MIPIARTVGAASESLRVLFELITIPAELLCRLAEKLRRARAALPRIEHEEHRPVLLRRVPRRQVVRVRDLRMSRTSDSVDDLAPLEFLGGRACRDEKEQHCDQ